MRVCGFCGVGLKGQLARRVYCGVVCQIMAHCRGTASERQCWVWTGAVRDTGYGVMRVRIDGAWRVRTPARVMYAAHKGEVPKTMSVLNTCQTRNCCNPRHLALAVQELALARASLGAGVREARP